jgi:hypothetical protein
VIDLIFHDVTAEEFERLVRAFSLNGSRAQDIADQIKSAFPDHKGNIRLNEVKFVATDPSTASVSVAAQIAAQSLGPEFKDWLNDPSKLVQLIAAAEGSQTPGEFSGSGEQIPLLAMTRAPSGWANEPFLLNDKETMQALQLLTRLGELGAGPTPKPELIGVELHRSDEKIKSSVLTLLDELSASRKENSVEPILMRAAEQMAIRYAIERFETGSLKVNAVHELLKQMSQQMGSLQKILQVQEEKMSKAGMLVESHSDLLDRMFWGGLPESSKKKALLSEDAACVPARNLRQYVELLLERNDRETASAILINYAGAVNAKDPEYRSKSATGMTQLADLFAAVGSSVLGDTTQKLADAITKEPDPEIESLLSAAFVRLSSEATRRKHYRSVAQACEAMEYVASRRPALEKELRSRIGVEGRLPEDPVCIHRSSGRGSGKRPSHRESRRSLSGGLRPRKARPRWLMYRVAHVRLTSSPRRDRFRCCGCMDRCGHGGPHRDTRPGAASGTGNATISFSATSTTTTRSDLLML